VQDNHRARIKPTWQAFLTDAREVVSDLVRFNEPDQGQRLQDHADAMFSDIVNLGEALLGSTDAVARTVPGYRTAKRQVQRAESAVIRDVKRRIDEISEIPLSGQVVDPRPKMLDQLLRASMESNPRRSLELLQMRILRSMVPDEARILAALSDGTRFAMIHVYVRSGGGVRAALENASTVGRVAAVHLNNAVPLYVAHLRELGLAEEGPAEELLSDQYALLTSEDYVQKAISEADGGIRGSRTVRRTLRISDIGKEFWADCAGRKTQPSVNAKLSKDEVYLSAYAGVAPPPEKKAVK
jgi:hypothetical protein